MKSLLLFLFFISSVNAQENPSLMLNISNIESIKGDIVIGVFNTDKNFLEKGSSMTSYKIKIKKNIESIIITDLPKGTYAISLFHDENLDEQCNRNFFGIPTESFAFSNNIKPKLSAPSFEDCKFILNKNMVLDIILLNY